MTSKYEHFFEDTFKVFMKIDKDNNGSISTETFQTYSNSLNKIWTEEELNIMDINSNGKVNFTEFLCASIFMHADKDENGMISTAEMKLAWAELMGNR